MSNGKPVDRGLVMGAQNYISAITVGGVRSTSALIMTPPTKYASGAVFTEYTVSVPIAHTAKLSFKVGLDDNSHDNYGAICVVKINGQMAWGSKTVAVRSGVWTPGQIDLTSYAGSKIQLRFIVYPVAQSLAAATWVGWSGVTLDADLSLPAAALQIGAGSVPNAVSSGSTLRTAGQGAWTVQTALPGSFVVFATPPPQPELGVSLLALPYRVWRVSYTLVDDVVYPAGVGGLGAYNGSGQILAATANGVTIDQTIKADPPRSGYTILSWALQVPAGASALNVTYGMPDAPPPFPPKVDYSGMRFSIRVNGTEIWGQSTASGGWLTVPISLNAYRGQKILLELVTDSLGTAIYDCGRWADLSLR